MNPGHPLLSVSLQRVVKDIEELVLKRRTSLVTEFKVSLVYQEGFQLVIPVAFKVTAKDSVYFNAHFESLVKCSPGFPFKPPEMFVKNKVLHPNIDLATGRVYLKLLDSLYWKSGVSINDVLLAFEEILVKPDFDFPVVYKANSEIYDDLFRSSEKFCGLVRKSLAGGCLFGYCFEVNYGKNHLRKRMQETVDENTKRIRLNGDSEFLKMRVF